ncbi:DUF3078 domain-containing protein [Zhouia sp. PK063]|uniref:DUF3078 domain-containing protein n=1 Tax=Zhouia sp. PK063 TaxID=3373602 RepID=UPI0037AB127E
MRKILFSFILTSLCIATTQAQTTTPQDTTYWTTGGKFTFLLNQSAFSNWVAGGENNVAGNMSFNYDFNYKKADWSWDNKLIASYGLTKTEGSDFTKKTDDRFELNSLLGKKASVNWYYSVYFNFKTQFDKGYKFSTDADGNEIRTEYTHSFSPAYLQFGPGALWKKSDNLKVNFAPAALKLVMVDKDFTTIDGYEDGDYFGVDAGKSIRYELGASIAAYYKFTAMENVSFENILNLYSNYLEDPQNVDIDYTLNVVMQINKYLSTNLAFQTIYDDNAFKGFQVREVFGVGFNYAFGAAKKKK